MKTNCRICGSEFEARWTVIGWTELCSLDCWRVHYARIEAADAEFAAHEAGGAK